MIMHELKEKFDSRKGAYKIEKRPCNDDGTPVKGYRWQRFGGNWYNCLSDAYDAVVMIVRNHPELYKIG